MAYIIRTYVRYVLTFMCALVGQSPTSRHVVEVGLCSSSWLAYAVLIVFALRFSFSLDPTQLFTMSVNLSTVLKWIKGMDSFGEWLRYDESGGKVMQIFCACALNTKSVYVRNYSSLFVYGISGTTLEKYNISKHQ